MLLRFVRPLVAAVLVASSLTAQQPAAGKDSTKKTPPAAVDTTLSITHHVITVDGKAFHYTATTGYLTMHDEKGEAKANIFFIAYTRDTTLAPAKRAITFAFNGGPGSSSVWLHLGAIGPRKVLMGEDGEALPPPYKLVDNPDTWLAFSDLVFIDPVTTGYSREAAGEDPKQFHGLEEDAQSVGDFIRLYATRFGRWPSPKFLAGESYGTTRAAALSGYLQDRYGMYLNGIVLISSILNFETADFGTGNDLPYSLFLPTYTATAWYHHKLAPDLQANLESTLDSVRAFALGDYTRALMAGDALTDAQRKDITHRLARFTGLSEDYVSRSNLRILDYRFTKELLRTDRRTVGRLDSRYTGIDADAVGEGTDYDPSYAAIYGTYTAMINDYLRTDLGYKNDLPYEILTGRVSPWNFGSARNRYANVGETLRAAMTQNPNLKVFVAAGYYDLATPFVAAEYTLAHLGLDPSLRGNITLKHYASGHMVYVRRSIEHQLTQDVAAFAQGAFPGGAGN